MRAIAERAGVRARECVLLLRLQRAPDPGVLRSHARRACRRRRTRLDELKDFKARLLLVMRAKLESIEPYHRFAGLLFRSAADPASPLNPFSAESQPVRQEATEVFRKVVAGSRGRIAPELRAELPNLLWLYHMGIVLSGFTTHRRGGAAPGG